MKYWTINFFWRNTGRLPGIWWLHWVAGVNVRTARGADPSPFAAAVVRQTEAAGANVIATASSQWRMETSLPCRVAGTISAKFLVISR